MTRPGIRCPACGEEMPRGMASCRYCRAPLAPAAITSDSAVPATHPTPEPELSESPPRSSPSVQRKREPRARRQVPREKRAKPKPAELQVKESSPSPQSTTAGVVKETPLTKDKKPSDVAWRARVLSCVDVLLLLAPMAMLGSSRLWNHDSRVFYDVYCSWPYANNVHSTCAIPPNIKDPATDPKDWPNAQSFRSEHSGGLNFAVADGASRVISASVDLKVYRALATIDGKEVVGDNY